MKILTVNLPITYLNMIKKLVGDDALYPSLSELIRVAVRDFLIQELENMKFFNNSQPLPPPKFDSQSNIKQDQFVQVPYGTNSEGRPEFKTFRIIKKESQNHV